MNKDDEVADRFLSIGWVPMSYYSSIPAFSVGTLQESFKGDNRPSRFASVEAHPDLDEEVSGSS